ncbi:MAG: hypothetical protein ABEI06_08830 [Halobacteriaceae archaeon]
MANISNALPMASDPLDEERRDEAYRDWQFMGNFNNSNVRFLGTVRGMPMYYDENKRTVMEGRLNHEEEKIELLEDDAIDLDPEETLGSALKRLGEESGWDTLTEFAEEHLDPDDEN